MSYQNYLSISLSLSSLSPLTYTPPQKRKAPALGVIIIQACLGWHKDFRKRLQEPIWVT